MCPSLILWRRMFEIERCYVTSYIPHMISNQPNERKSPALHLLFKSLPLRCQFRNFTNVSQTHMRTYPKSIEFFKRVLVWTLLGTFYTWYDAQPSASNVKLLYRCCICDDRMNDAAWIRFFSTYDHLVFYAVKEYIIWCTHQLPGLQKMLCRYPKWVEYKHEIWSVMNTARDTWRHNVGNFARVNDVLSKFCPKQMKCMRQLLPNSSKDATNAFRTLVVKLKNGQKYDGPNVKTLSDLCTLLDQAILDCAQRRAELEHVLNHGGPKAALQVYCQLDEAEQQKIFNWLHLRRISQNIHMTALSHRHAMLQLKAVVERHDLKYDANDKSNVEKATNYWFCLSCETFRGFVVKPVKSKRCSNSGGGGGGTSHNINNNCTAYGHEKVAYDVLNGQVYCVSNTQRKHSSLDSSTSTTKSCLDFPCMQINLFGRMVRFFNTTLVLCTECASPFVLSANQAYLDHGGAMHCGTCSNMRIYEDNSFCSFCAHRCTVLKEFVMYDDTSKPHKWTTARLCPRHRRQRWSSNKILLKSMLWKLFAEN